MIRYAIERFHPETGTWSRDYGYRKQGTRRDAARLLRDLTTMQPAIHRRVVQTTPDTTTAAPAAPAAPVDHERIARELGVVRGPAYLMNLGLSRLDAAILLQVEP